MSHVPRILDDLSESTCASQQISQNRCSPFRHKEIGGRGRLCGATKGRIPTFLVTWIVKYTLNPKLWPETILNQMHPLIQKHRCFTEINNTCWLFHPSLSCGISWHFFLQPPAFRLRRSSSSCSLETWKPQLTVPRGPQLQVTRRLSAPRWRLGFMVAIWGDMPHEGSHL